MVDQGVQGKKCLVVDEMNPTILPLLEGLGLEVSYLPQITRAEVLEHIGDCACLVVRSKLKIDEEVLAHAEGLEFIIRAGAGIDNLDVNAIENRGVKIINAPEGNRDAVGEHTIGMLLSLFNNIIKSDKEVRGGVWDREGNRGIELMGKTVGLVGYGNMGRAFAQRLSAFNCEVLAYDKYKKSFQSPYAQEVDMEVLFEKADIVSFHVPLTSETKMMVDEAYLGKFKKNIYLVNTARGGILSLRALVNGIKQGKVLGAALDVLENEKLDKLTEGQKEDLAFLTQSNKTVLTPHIAGWTHESYQKINEVLVLKLKKELL